MPRLQTIQQLSDYQNKEEVATFNLKQISTNAKVLGAYAKLIEAYEASEFLVQKNDYDASSITVYRVKPKAELEKILKSAQDDWDEKKKQYDQAKAESEGTADHGVEEWPSYKKNGVRYFADAENWVMPALVEKDAVEAWEAAKNA